MSHMIAGYRDYRHTGRVKEPERFAAYGMVSGMTFGVGELFLLPEMARESKRLKAEIHHFRVYFDTERNYVCHIHKASPPQTHRE
jgi:hypothetical protein